MTRVAGLQGLTMQAVYHVGTGAVPGMCPLHLSHTGALVSCHLMW